MEKLILKFLPAIDFVLSLFVYPAALLLKKIRRFGVQRLPKCKEALFKIGVFPIRDHYFEPLFDARHLKRPLSESRNLPAIDWNVEEQLMILESFSFNEELRGIPDCKGEKLEFYFNNGSFESGDAEYWFNIIRHKKPRRIIEVGSGNSTLMAIKAVKGNEQEDPNYQCEHICIEPYEAPWLDKTGITIIRDKVENVDKRLFLELGVGDILFIDSSHVIRPQGDVVYEYLELIPSLNRGVIVHVHDIFSPRDYLEQWIKEEVRLWNEQYLLEAFLSHNREWKIIGALNYLHHNHFKKLAEKCPYLTPDREPGSFYVEKVV